MAKFDHTAFRAAAQSTCNPLNSADQAALRAALLRRQWAGYNPDGSRA